MKKFLPIFAYLLPLVSSSQTRYWQQEVNYTINVALNDVENTLNGFVKIQYINNSPDTLHFIWFHLWPNAYKNDRTAFSEQMLQNGRTDFYFSDKEQKGYINRLDFRINDEEAKTEHHPFYIDVVKVILPKALLPSEQILITTTFHEKLPFNFSRGGHVGKSYQVTQWYPKPAVYDDRGWHEMPYLDQGEFYSEFGSFDVRITLPKNYVVAATGELQNDEEKNWLITRSRELQPKKQETKEHRKLLLNNKPKSNLYKPLIPSDTETKTLQYKQNNVHDFAWFADKNFIVNHDTLQLQSGRIIDAYSFYLPDENSFWQKSIEYIKDAVQFRSALIGEYPYNVVSAVEAKLGFDGGMEYPTITSISTSHSAKDLDFTIEHEVGHNWFYGILANNERRYPWMDEGINTYYDNRYEEWETENKIIVENVSSKNNWFKNKMPDDRDKLSLDVIIKEKKDQPISTSSENFSELNYNLIAYTKTSLWLKQLEKKLGTKMFDSCMKEYFRQWQFKHPYPENFKSSFEETSRQNLDDQFSLLEKKGSLNDTALKKIIKPTFLFSQKNTEQINYIGLAPALGYNEYDKLMIGAIIHNINLPPNHFEFVLAPMYATNSKQFNGIGDIGYSWYPGNQFQKIDISLTLSKFSSSSGIDSNGNNIFGGFYKISPAMRLILNTKSSRSTIEKWIDFRTYIIGEKGFNYVIKSTDSNYYPSPQKYSTRYLNQLTFNIEDYRVLYPYDAQLQFQQASNFYRINFTTNYFFNYSRGGGMSVRFFAAKFGYIGGNSLQQQFNTYSYQPKLTASIGSDDYTYSNYFIGRNEFQGFASQQIMMRDGGLKIRTDEFQDLQGRSDNWIAAANFNTTLPQEIMPPWMPLKIFLDVGTYADAWGNNPPTSKFLYVAGLQLSLIKNIINIYAPVLYSSDFRSQLKTLGSQNTFVKRISFSIDIQNINFKKIFRNTPY